MNSKKTSLHASAFQALFETAPDAMIITDVDGRIVLANPQAERLFGYASGVMHGRSVDTLVPKHARAVHRHHRAQYIAQPRVRPMGTGQELVGQRANGSQFPVEIALSPIKTQDGHFYVASIRDVSETQRARQALLRARYDTALAEIGRLVLEATNDDMAFEKIPNLIATELGVDDVAFVFTLPNTATVEVPAANNLNMKLQELVQTLFVSDLLPGKKHLGEAATITLDDLEEARRERVRTLLAEAGSSDLIAAPLYDRGRPMGALLAIAREPRSFDRDKVHFFQSTANLLAATVQRNRTEEQLAHAQRLDSIGQLTGGVAHDFNNLLTVISGNLQLLEAELGDRPQSRETLASALRAVGRGAELTRKLLAFARLQHLNPRPISPRTILNELGPMLARALGETISVEIECTELLPDIFVDASELDTAILNLALNARDAMPRGGALRLTVRAQSIALHESNIDLTPGNYVVVGVHDTGVGMSPEVLARAFEPFFTTKEDGRGNGLGLSMVYGFVKQSGGHIDVESRLGYGTHIELFLPAVRPGEMTSTTGEAVVASDGYETILVVEDEADVRAIAVKFLHSFGYATFEAADAAQALILLREKQEIALLFSDVILGAGMNGVELTIAARDLRPGMPTLLVSGYEQLAMQSDAALLASLPLLRKPYRREELGAAVRRAIDTCR